MAAVSEPYAGLSRAGPRVILARERALTQTLGVRPVRAGRGLLLRLPQEPGGGLLASRLGGSDGIGRDDLPRVRGGPEILAHHPEVVVPLPRVIDRLHVRVDGLLAPVIFALALPDGLVLRIGPIARHPRGVPVTVDQDLVLR